MDPEEADVDMSEQESLHEVDHAEIKDTDIVFECPFCGKSLAIDYRGAGLNIACSDCGKMVEVPIPEGMDIGDIDKSDEEMEAVVLSLRKALALSDEKIASLQEDIQELEGRREALETQRSDVVFKFGVVAEQIGMIQKSLDDIAESIRKISEVVKP